ncbi:DNA-directed RNA polymerase subunit H [Candidatus Woesearchaeota archaeon]|nr:DNA-directed RNA polymerase subunit H [Candidatus Woesearchaeota archaeon]
MATFDVTKHVLVPKHQKVSEKELASLLEAYGIQVENLPRVFKNDPALQHLDLKDGDVVKISRKSPTAGDISFYRRVVA